MCVTVNFPSATINHLFTNIFNLTSKSVKKLQIYRNIHWKQLPLCGFCLTSPWGLQSSRWTSFWIHIRVCEHWDDFQYQCGVHTSWEPDRQRHPWACSAEITEISVDLAPRVPLSAVHHISCSLHFAPDRGQRENRTNSLQGKAFHLQTTKDRGKQLMYHSEAAHSLCVTCFEAGLHGVQPFSLPFNSLRRQSTISYADRELIAARNYLHKVWTNNTHCTQDDYKINWTL